MALRSALGATGNRVTRQLLTESLVLSQIGGASVFLSRRCHWRSWFCSHPTRCTADRDNIDWVVLGFALLLSILTAIAFGRSRPLNRDRPTYFPGCRGSLDRDRARKIGQYRAGLIISEMALRLCSWWSRTVAAHLLGTVSGKSRIQFIECGWCQPPAASSKRPQGRSLPYIGAQSNFVREPCSVYPDTWGGNGRSQPHPFPWV